MPRTTFLVLVLILYNGANARSTVSCASADVTPNTDESLHKTPSCSVHISSLSARAHLRFLDDGLCALLEASLYRQGIGSEGRSICEGPFGFPSPCADLSVAPNDIAKAKAKINSTTRCLTEFICGTLPRVKLEEFEAEG